MQPVPIQGFYNTRKRSLNNKRNIIKISQYKEKVPKRLHTQQDSRFIVEVHERLKYAETNRHK